MAKGSTRPVVIRLAVLGGLMSTVITGIPDAHADSLGEQKFIRDMAARGVVGRPTDQDLINSGYDVCRMLGDGTAKNAVVNTIAEQSLQSPLNYSGGGVSQQQALWFVNAAWVDLCPSLNVPDM
jgi:hypothetical protein